MTKTFNIYRRAYSVYTLAENFTGSWVDAMERASVLERVTNKDGEYIVRFEGEPAEGVAHPPCPVQADWAYL